MQLMLRKAAKALHANDKFTEEEMHNYRMAVTEREVRNGCITMPDNYVKDHVIIYTRILNNINLQNLKRASAFIDIMDRKIHDTRCLAWNKCFVFKAVEKALNHSSSMSGI